MGALQFRVHVSSICINAASYGKTFYYLYRGGAFTPMPKYAPNSGVCFIRGVDHKLPKVVETYFLKTKQFHHGGGDLCVLDYDTRTALAILALCSL